VIYLAFDRLGKRFGKPREEVVEEDLEEDWTAPKPEQS